jgi:hypothetical protein
LEEELRVDHEVDLHQEGHQVEHPEVLGEVQPQEGHEEDLLQVEHQVGLEVVGRVNQVVGQADLSEVGLKR